MDDYRKIKGNTSYPVHIIIFLLLTIILASIVTNFQFVYGRENQTESHGSSTVNLQKIETKKIHVGDFDIAYKEFGKGDPILLISGAWAPLDIWHPILLGKLASNHTVITFDNRGIGNTSFGNEKFSMEQFANDTAGLMDALKIKKADVLGMSLGGMIAQELALNHPDKVRNLVIYGSTCGGKDSIPSPQMLKELSNSTGTSSERYQRFLPLLFPQEWRSENPDFSEKLPRSSEVIQNKTLDLQIQALNDWPGVCDKLDNINNPTLVIVGAEDLLTVPANSLLITEKIPGAWLIQIAGGGHALALQYPEKFSDIVLTFLES